MQYGVFGPADIQVHAAGLIATHPVTLCLSADETLVVARVAKSQVIPAGAGPLRHGVYLPQRFVGIANPIFRFCQRRLAGAARLVIIQRRWNDRQLIFAERLVLSIPPNNGNRLAPIALTRKEPVAQLVIDCSFAGVVLLEPVGDFLFGFRRWQAVDYGRVDRNPFTDKSDRFFIARLLHDYADRQVEFSMKLHKALLLVD